MDGHRTQPALALSRQRGCGHGSVLPAKIIRGQGRSKTIWHRCPIQSLAGYLAHQEGTIEVGAFHDSSIAITPRTGRGGEFATYRLLLQNKGNAALQATLDGSDPDDLLALSFDQPTVVLEPGAMVNAQLQVNARATFYDASRA
jgi:hypothetical protein